MIIQKIMEVRVKIMDDEEVEVSTEEIPEELKEDELEGFSNE